MNAFIVRGVPTFLSQTGGWKGDILEIAEAAEKGGHFLQAAAVTLACKGAVKAGDYLDTRAIKALLLDLAKTENPSPAHTAGRSLCGLSIRKFCAVSVERRTRHN